jgi:small subunit ribosomal protein S16
MLKIRLKRLGRKKKPFYKIAVMTNLSRRDGKTIADLGYYDPIKKIININNQKLLEYLRNGAYPTTTVRHLIIRSLKKIKVVSSSEGERDQSLKK